MKASAIPISPNSSGARKCARKMEIINPMPCVDSLPTKSHKIAVVDFFLREDK